MIPRDCDSDDCDYETFHDGQGQPYLKWVHVPGCRPAFGPDAVPHAEYFQG